MESAASPALGNVNMMSTKKVKLASEVQPVKESKKLESSKHEAKDEEKKEQSNFGYNLKIIIFLVFSFFLMYEAMTPSRRAPYKKNRK